MIVQRDELVLKHPYDREDALVAHEALKLTWSKRGQKAEHTKIDEAKNEMTLENVDRTHADTYSCTANNDIGDPVTSEFQVLIKCKFLKS